MCQKIPIFFLLLCTPTLALGDTSFSTNLNGGGGYFASAFSKRYKVEDNSALFAGQLTLSFGINESLAFGSTLATGLNSEETDEGGGTTFGKGFGYLEAFLRYFLVTQGDFRLYLKGGVSLSVTEDMLARVILISMGIRDATHTTGTSGLSISLGGGVNYFLTDHFYANLDVTDLFLSMGDGVRLNNSIIGTLGVGFHF